MLYLKQSTAVTLKIGPAISSVDASLATGLTIAQADVRLSKNGGDNAQKHDASSATHDESGLYDCALDATDTDTLGTLQLYVFETDTMPIAHDYIVVTANVYDTLCSTDYLDVNLLANQAVATIGAVNTVNDKTNYSLSASGVDAIFDEPLTAHTTVATLGRVVSDVNQATFGKWAISGTTLTFYASDNTTVLKEFTLNTAVSPTSRTPV